MTTGVAELTAPWGNILLGPRHGPGVCERCFNLTDVGYARCYHCAGNETALVTIAPISYSVAGEQLHHALAGYKRSCERWTAVLGRQLAAVLWRHLHLHEPCLARAARVSGFPLVTTVPSERSGPDRPHPLQRIVGHDIAVTRSRHAQLLLANSRATPPRTFDPERFTVVRPLDGEPVLVIDDTWTTGASVQSAAAALRQAGAGPVAALVIGRHVHRDWHENDRRLRALEQAFDWTACALCA